MTLANCSGAKAGTHETAAAIVMAGPGHSRKTTARNVNNELGQTSVDSCPASAIVHFQDSRMTFDGPGYSLNLFLQLFVVCTLFAALRL